MTSEHGHANEYIALSRQYSNMPCLIVPENSGLENIHADFVAVGQGRASRACEASSRVEMRDIGNVRKPLKPVSMTASTTSCLSPAPWIRTRMTASRCGVTNPVNMPLLPASSQSISGRITNPQNVERSVRMFRLGTPQGSQFIDVQFVCACVNIKDEEFPFVGRFHRGTYLLIVQRLPTPFNLFARIPWMGHGPYLPSRLCFGAYKRHLTPSSDRRQASVDEEPPHDHASASSRVLASCKSAVSNPSVNQ